WRIPLEYTGLYRHFVPNHQPLSPRPRPNSVESRSEASRMRGGMIECPALIRTTNLLPQLPVETQSLPLATALDRSSCITTAHACPGKLWIMAAPYVTSCSMVPARISFPLVDARSKYGKSRVVSCSGPPRCPTIS